MIDSSADTFCLSECLKIPIAADSVASIEAYVGTIKHTIAGRNNRINALCIEPDERAKYRNPLVPLWQQPEVSFYEEQLHPKVQIWVHVDYHQYRTAYLKLSMSPIPKGYVLDHIQNREATRLRDYSHPYLRLCAISHHVNTNAGVNTGGEGMEKKYRRYLRFLPKEEREIILATMTKSRIIYADPMDITKMLNIFPGTGNLDGVGDTHELLFY